MCVRTSLALGLLLVTAHASPALASKGDAVIVVESHASARPDDADQLLGPLYEELTELGYQADAAALSARMREKVGEPGDELEAARIAEAVELATTGYQHWLDGNPKRAKAPLEAAQALFFERPATLARAPKLRDHVFTTLVGLSLVYHRLGDAERATATMAELLRSYPDREISRAKYGPEPRTLYKRIESELEEQGRGTLRVRSDDPAVTVFLNERYAGVGNLDLENLYAGTYRIYLQKGKTRGPVHRVTVTPGTESQLSIAWGFESSVRSSAGFVGFEFDGDAAAHQRAFGYAVTAARRVGANGVIVIGIEPYQGRRSVVATVLSLSTNKPLRAGAVAVEPTAPNSEQMRALARFLAGDRPGPGVIVRTEEVVAKPELRKDPVDTASAGKPRALTWAALIGGGIALAGGVTLIAIHQPAQTGSGQNEFARETRVPGIAMAVGGAVLVGTGVWLWKRDRSSSRRSTLSVTPTSHDGWAISWSGSF